MIIQLIISVLHLNRNSVVKVYLLNSLRRRRSHRELRLVEDAFERVIIGWKAKGSKVWHVMSVSWWRLWSSHEIRSLGRLSGDGEKKMRRVRGSWVKEPISGNIVEPFSRFHKLLRSINERKGNGNGGGGSWLKLSIERVEVEVPLCNCYDMEWIERR